MISALIRFCLTNRLVVFILAILAIVWGLMVAPFDWELDGLPRDPVPVDAIPDIGENQQIVFTEWPGRSPQDMEDQVTYPLTTALLGLPEVRTIRSYSMFGFSSIYIIFRENVDFYWSRSRILEKLNSLPQGTLPDGVTARIGPDATALGQVFWYTLEGRDPAGQPTGGWDLDELRSEQDWYVRYALQGVEGVAEVASIGGFVREYQVDVDPDQLRSYGIPLEMVFAAVRGSNLDTGARTIEVNRVEYVIRGVGFIKSLDDLRQTVVATRDGVPITLEQVAQVEFGPALRRGALDKGGVEAVGGVVVTRYGENPLAVIQRVKDKIAQIELGLPRKTLDDGTVSQVRIVPFYDRTGLIHETLGTLEEAVTLEILITVLVVILMVMHLRSAILISALLPMAVLLAFIGMKLFKVDANIVALSGIAIAIGTIVDMGIVLTENILRHLQKARPEESRLEVVHRACTEVGGAVLTAVLTTVISFLPVFTMEAAEGKLFKPLAYTKTFALIASIVLALTVLPPLAHMLIARIRKSRATEAGRPRLRQRLFWGLNAVTALLVAIYLANEWRPLGEQYLMRNLIFVVLVVAGLLGPMLLFVRVYPRLLGWVLRAKALFMGATSLVVLFGFTAWLGWGTIFGWLPAWAKQNPVYSAFYHALPGFGQEFMPDLDEGAFLLMPTTMPHASIGEVMDVLRKQDMAITAIPEVETAVGKLGRVESPLDPAPISMIETLITYKPEFITDADGNRVRQWRDHIRSPEDIWDEIIQAANIPGTTSAPKLQPISARIVMLQSGMRAPMGLKVYGPDLESIEATALDLEALLKQVPAVRAETVLADRIVGKPYLEIEIDREAISRHGLRINDVQNVIEAALGGRMLTTTVEGRERYSVRVRYQRERRDSIEAMERILVAAPGGAQIPLRELARITYRRGPQMIKSEDTFLVGYVIFDKQQGLAEVDVVEQARDFLQEKLHSGELVLPAGVSYRFTGSYENQVRAEKRLSIVLPMALALIFLIIYLQFRKVSVTLMVFSGIAYAWSGGFILIWLYGQDWFLHFSIFGHDLRELFQISTINLSVAVWVGFLALFGIATDDGVLMATYLEQRFAEEPPDRRSQIHARVVEAASKRVRPAMMTSATTILALLPVLTSTGRGSDVMVPMAIPTFGGMLLASVTLFVVPVLYSSLAERRLN